jgi:transcriptional regulator with XRE-family HTH domain
MSDLAPGQQAQEPKLPSLGPKERRAQALRALLLQRFEEARLRNPKVSLRGFAQKIGLAPGALSGLLSGKRNASSTLTDRIAQALHLNPSEREKLLEPKSVERSYHVLSTDEFRALAEWEHLAILSLTEVRDFEPTPTWIATRLGVSSSRVKQVISRLLELGLLGAEGAPSELYPWGTRLRRLKSSLSSSDGIASLPVRKAHLETLELAAESLKTVPVELRDFTSMTLPISTARLPEAKACIRKFEEELCDLIEVDQKTEVYRLAVALFPLTKPKETL